MIVDMLLYFDNDELQVFFFSAGLSFIIKEFSTHLEFSHTKKITCPWPTK